MIVLGLGQINNSDRGFAGHVGIFHEESHNNFFTVRVRHINPADFVRTDRTDCGLNTQSMLIPEVAPDYRWCWCGFAAFPVLSVDRSKSAGGASGIRGHNVDERLST